MALAAKLDGMWCYGAARACHPWVVITDSAHQKNSAQQKKRARSARNIDSWKYRAGPSYPTCRGNTTLASGGSNSSTITPPDAEPEVAGRLGTQVGAHYLEKSVGGRGVLLSGGGTLHSGGGRRGADAATIALGMADECRRGGLQSRRNTDLRSGNSERTICSLAPASRKRNS